MLKAFTIVFKEGLAEHEPAVRPLAALALLRFLAALRVLFFPRLIAKYQNLNIFEKLYNPKRSWEPLYFAIHKFYVCRSFSFRERFKCAMIHHEHEANNYDRRYFEQVYPGNGIILWEKTINAIRFKIVLTAVDDNRHEGELCVILYVDNSRLCRMSLCYIDASIFGLPSYHTMLISRNQTDVMTTAREVFDRSFKQSAPQLFCLFAICGIATSNDFRNILAIRHDSQIAYDKKYESGFRNSYTELWERFGGVDVDGRTHLLDVPLKLSPLLLVNPTHRRRARCRRRIWDEIARSACSALDSYRVAPATVRTCRPNGPSMSATLVQIGVDAPAGAGVPTK
jgi:uncharacterized protein VirK/YbjX